MSAQDQLTEDVSVPRAVSSPRAKLVYLYLDRVGPAPVADIAHDLDLQKLAVYGVLRSLRRRGLVDERDGTYAVA